MNRKLLLISTACAILGASFGTAYAQDKKTDDDNGTQVGELVITAQKREEKLQDVPVAVTAFSGETRDLLGVVSIFDLTNNTPGLVYSVGLDRSFIRGVGRNTNAPGSDPGIAVYQDGVYSASTVPLGRAPIFSERTEVLRGPQGTLYGRNSIGGAMNIISTRPTDEFQGEVRATYGDHNNRSFQAKIDGPITSWLRYELGTAQIKQTEGFFHNANGGPDEGGPNDEKFYIGALDFNVGEKFDGFVRLESYSYDRRYRGFSPNGGTTVNPTFDDQTVISGLNVNQRFNGCTTAAATCTNRARSGTYYSNVNVGALDPFAFKTDTPNHTYDHDTWNTSTNLTFHGNGMDLKYIGGYNQYTYDNIQDGDGTDRGAFTFNPGPFDLTPFGFPGFFQPQPDVTLFPIIAEYREDKHWSGHELNLSSTNDFPIQWIVGAYYYQEGFTNTVRGFSPLQTQLAALPGNAHSDYYRFIYKNSGQASALFGQLDWEFAPKWKVTAGLRNSRDWKNSSENDHYYYFVPAFATAGAYTASDVTSTSIRATCNPTGLAVIGTGKHQSCRVDPTTNTRFLEGSWRDGSGTLGLEYHPSDETLLYLKYSRGFKSGGFNLSQMSNRPFLGAETLDAYEGGYKFSVGRKLTVNAAVYYYDYRDAQDFISVITPINTIAAQGINIPKSRNYGLDLEFNWHPISQFTLLGNYSYINAKVTDGGSITVIDTLDLDATSTSARSCGPRVPYTLVAGRTQAQPQCITGTSLKGAPENKFGLTALYRFDFDPGSLSMSASYNWRGGNYSSYFRNPAYLAPSFGSWNARAVWSGAGKKYSVIGFVNNLTDERGYEYVTAAANPSGGAPLVNPVYTVPRTWGVEIQRRF